MSNYIALLLLFATVTTVFSWLDLSRLLAERYIESPHVTNFGKWGILENCSPGSLVNGIRIKVEVQDGELFKDDTALNAIELRCIDKISGNTPYTISSTRGPYGEWHPWVDCGVGNWMIGFQMRIEGCCSNDQTAANDIEMKCASGKWTKKEWTVKPEGGHRWGGWRGWRVCPKGKAICGVQTQVQVRRSFDPNTDDTALNNVRFHCCHINSTANMTEKGNFDIVNFFSQ